MPNAPLQTGHSIGLIIVDVQRMEHVTSFYRPFQVNLEMDYH